jgi:hypothetical protein
MRGDPTKLRGFFAASLVTAVKKPKKRGELQGSLNIMRVRYVIKLVEADG